MRASTFLPLALSLSISSLASASSPPYGPYNLTSYASDCIGGIGCLYSFSVSFKPNHKYPPPYLSDTEPCFYATCLGDDQTGAFQACNDTRIAANLEQSPFGDGNIFVQHTWSVPITAASKAATYVVTGNATVPLITGPDGLNVTIFADKKRRMKNVTARSWES